MTNVTTQINITAKDSTAAAFASADQNLSGLSSTALKVTGALAAVGVSVAGVVSAVKGVADATIQFQQFTSTLNERAWLTRQSSFSNLQARLMLPLDL